MKYDDIRASLTDYFKEAIKRRIAQISETGRPSKDELDHYRDGVSYGSMGYALEMRGDPQLKSFLNWSGIETTEGSKDRQSMRIEYERAYSSFCQHMLNYDKSLTSYSFDTAVLQSQPKAASINSQTTLNKVIELYIAEHESGKLWGAKMKLDKRQHFELLLEIIGTETEIADVSAENARTVKSTIQRLPRNRNKLPATRSLKLEQILELENIEKLSTKTINQYLQSYSSLFGWAKKQSYIDHHYFEKLSIKIRKKGKNEGRQSFSRSQFEVMSEELLENKRGLIKKDYQKWGPLVAMYTGARLNEIAQLELGDVKVKEGVNYFDLNESGENKRLKSTASFREIPIHSKLIDFGLLEYISGMQLKKETRLFPDFSYSASNGYGRTLGRWFNEVFLVKLGLKTTQHSFHSFRHTMSNELQQQDAQLPMVQAILGHEQEGVTLQHYSKLGYTMKQLSEALEKFRW